MKNLETTLKIAAASVFCLYLKIHNFHFHVTGPNFYQYHKFLDKFYKDVFESFDAISEEIRSLDMLAPATMNRLQQLSIIRDNPAIPPAQEMLKELLIDNDALILVLDEVNKLSNDHIGLQNFIQSRSDAHSKWGWMLRSLTQEETRYEN